ncbi:hypothetical protein PC129_g5422 [Phytophthora cactorum]|uniref:Ankyrin repeat-containing domain n=1 Tax=Phytophthora cactorum TaxID=29920 RepID=A0A329SUW6_9STRA|nr:hypothetical protein Pcac1_g14868 [Phytophthora cactorum]KAG2922015.1 hypothetical protein PC114_g5451 [Phytophthora cactorum]KAG2946519.1 hypothetical protein PC117_g7573 [Phytophthora cactorum]KAG2977535.1 hypothetical protein PC120_g25481 [Phytophthora cactorum]KAG3027683.1 hypothetical protein PC119_g7266 [Phytophthora cactorum]
MDGAASNGHFEVVEYLHEHRSEGCTTDAMDLAAGGGHLDVVKWLDGNRLEGCTVQAIQKSVVRGDLRLVEFLTAHYAQFVAQIDPLNCVNNFEILIFLQMHHPQFFRPRTSLACGGTLREAIQQWS